MYPTFMFFPKFDKDGEVYLPGKFDENWSEYNITKFLNINCDTSRTTGGFLDKTVRMNIGYTKQDVLLYMKNQLFGPVLKVSQNHQSLSARSFNELLKGFIAVFKVTVYTKKFFEALVMFKHHSRYPRVI